MTPAPAQLTKEECEAVSWGQYHLSLCEPEALRKAAEAIRKLLARSDALEEIEARLKTAEATLAQRNRDFEQVSKINIRLRERLQAARVVLEENNLEGEFADALNLIREASPTPSESQEPVKDREVRDTPRYSSGAGVAVRDDNLASPSTTGQKKREGR